MCGGARPGRLQGGHRVRETALGLGGPCRGLSEPSLGRATAVLWDAWGAQGGALGRGAAGRDTMTGLLPRAGRRGVRST